MKFAINIVWLAACFGLAAQSQVILIRASATSFYVQTTIANAGNQRIQWEMDNITTNISNVNNWRFEGVTVVGPAGTQVLADPAIQGVYEYAYQFGTVDDFNAGGGNYCGTHVCFTGGYHGNEKITGYTLTADGVDEAGLAVGHSVGALAVVWTQTMNELLPSNTAIVDGTVALTHTFTASGLSVHHARTYDTSYRIKTAYSGMNYYSNLYLGTNNPITTAVVGNSAPYTLVHNGAVPLNAKVATASGYNSALHSYTLTMTLPSGGPDDNGDWSRDSANFNELLDESVVTTTATASSGSTVLTVASATGIVPTLTVSAVGVPQGTTVISVPGTVNISAQTTAPLSSTSASFGVPYAKQYACWNDLVSAPPSTSSHTTNYSVSYSGTPITPISITLSGLSITGVVFRAQ